MKYFSVYDRARSMEEHTLHMWHRLLLAKTLFSKREKAGLYVDVHEIITVNKLYYGVVYV